MNKDRWTVAASMAAISGLTLGIAVEAVIGGAGAAVGLGAGIAVAAGFLKRTAIGDRLLFRR